MIGIFGVLHSAEGDPARALAQGYVGEDLGGAADDWGVVIDGGVAGDHADVFRAENVAEGEEFLAGERLDRDGIIGAATLAERLELEGEGDQRFPGAGGGVEDDVVAGEEFEDGFLLVVVGFGAGGGEVTEENVEDVVRCGGFGEILAVERGGHARERLWQRNIRPQSLSDGKEGMKMSLAFATEMRHVFPHEHAHPHTDRR